VQTRTRQKFSKHSAYLNMHHDIDVSDVDGH